jgi:hypothetical protein
MLDRERLRPRPGRFTPPPPVKRAVTHWRGGWVGPRASLDGCGKPRPPPLGSVKKQMTVIQQVGFELGNMSCYGVTTRLSLRTISLYCVLIAHCTIPKPSSTSLTSRLQSVVFRVLASSDTKRHNVYTTNRAVQIDVGMLWAGLQPGIPV